MRLLFPAAAVVALFAAWWMIAHRGPAPLVVYCAHDSIYSEKILRDFEKRTGIPVAIRFDTEATKSLGLVELLVAEKDAPRCDVFWNNEPLGTMDLAERGLLEPYKGAGWQRIPEKFRDAEGRWTGFAARMRVEIVNTQTTQRRWAIAKPLYGTTLTHYAVLWRHWGNWAVVHWHHDSRAKGWSEFNGNAAVKDAVAAGACDIGYTDTDDFFEAKDAGQPVTMQPVRIEGAGTIAIPNTVAIIRRAKHGKDARKLVDFLLSEETELALARSKSRQIPLGPCAMDQLPTEVRELVDWTKESVDLTEFGVARAQCLAWLKAEYTK